VQVKLFERHEDGVYKPTVIELTHPIKLSQRWSKALTSILESVADAPNYGDCEGAWIDGKFNAATEFDQTNKECFQMKGSDHKFARLKKSKPLSEQQPAVGAFLAIFVSSK
jgi:hypothetical protein